MTPASRSLSDEPIRVLPYPGRTDYYRGGRLCAEWPCRLGRRSIARLLRGEDPADVRLPVLLYIDAYFPEPAR